MENEPDYFKPEDAALLDSLKLPPEEKEFLRRVWERTDNSDDGPSGPSALDTFIQFFTPTIWMLYFLAVSLGPEFSFFGDAAAIMTWVLAVFELGLSLFPVWHISAARLVPRGESLELRREILGRDLASVVLPKQKMTGGDIYSAACPVATVVLSFVASYPWTGMLCGLLYLLALRCLIHCRDRVRRMIRDGICRHDPELVGEPE